MQTAEAWIVEQRAKWYARKAAGDGPPSEISVAPEMHKLLKAYLKDRNVQLGDDVYKTTEGVLFHGVPVVVEVPEKVA